MSRVTKIFIVLLVACGSLGYYLYLDMVKIWREVMWKQERTEREWREKIMEAETITDSLERTNDSLHRVNDSLKLKTDSVGAKQPF